MERCAYSERVVDSFSHQIKSEYYGGNISVSIQGIALEHFSALPQTELKAFTKPCPRHLVFHSFFSDYSKQDSATTTAHRKLLIELFKKITDVNIKYNMGNNDGCAEQYRCASELYLMSVFPNVTQL